MKIGPHTIDEGHCFIIAEAGINHGGDLALAHRLIDSAALCQADAVKFQTFDPAELGAPDLAPYALPEHAWAELADHAIRRGILFLSTPFDTWSASLLAHLPVPAWKIASGEIINTKLLRWIGGQGQPVLLSTGMATADEITAALKALGKYGGTFGGSRGWGVILLHCVSAYPAPPEQMNLRAMDTLRDYFGAPVGLSDHTLGWDIALAAVAMGACVIEKHFTVMDGRGPDHAMSLRPDEFSSMVRRIRTIEAAMGDGIKRCMPCEEPVKAKARRDPATGRRPV